MSTPPTIAATSAPATTVAAYRASAFAQRALKRFLCLDDFEPAARAFLPRALFGYVAGATETNASLRANRAAFDELAFLPRMLVNVSKREQSVELFGTRYSSPFGIAPMGISALTAYRGDIVQARAAAQAGVPMALSGTSLIRLEEVLEQAPGTWFQAYLGRNPDDTAALVERAKASRAAVLIVTVDCAVLPNRENNVRNHFKTPLRPDLRLLYDGATHPRWTLGVFLRTLLVHGMPHFENVGAQRGVPLVSRDVTRDTSGREYFDWEALKAVRRRWTGPLVLKGILHPDDAKLARAAGADGIIVSNHGGRQLDGAVAPLRALPQIVDAAGSMVVMADGGFRRGTDILKALALGARSVLIGRPMNYAAALHGEPGVTHAIGLLRAEIHTDMGLLGINRLGELGPEFLIRGQDERLESTPKAPIL